MKVVSPSVEGVAEAVAALRTGEGVVYPTETLYGLGFDPFSEAALNTLYEAKQRDRTEPVLLVISSLEQLGPLVEGVSPKARACMDAFWPGPLSIVFKKSEALPEKVCGGKDTVCVRWTSSPVAQDLCAAFGGAITSTSANRTGERPAQSVGEVDVQGVAIGIDGGRIEGGVPSTVLDPETGTIFREGAVSNEAVEAILRSV